MGSSKLMVFLPLRVGTDREGWPALQAFPVSSLIVPGHRSLLLWEPPPTAPPSSLAAETGAGMLQEARLSSSEI